MILCCLLCGLISGLSLMLTGNSLNFWLADTGIKLSTIGLATLVTLPYAVNFLWAPLLEKWSKRSGLRRTLLTLTSIEAILLIALGYTNPTTFLTLTIALASLAALLSSSQDILLNAIRTEISQNNKIGTSTSGYVIGYRAGMLIGGAGAIFAADYVAWSYIYFTAALLLLASMFALLQHLERFGSTISMHRSEADLPSDTQTLWQIARSIAPWKTLLAILAFLALYRAGDNLLSSMLNPMLLTLGFSNEAVAGLGKTLGMAGSVMGGIIGGLVINNIGVRPSLWVLGIIHTVGNLLFILLWLSPTPFTLAAVVIISSITGGMCMSAYIAFITSLCQGKHRGTKYSFLSSTMGLSRSILPVGSGWIVESLGWQAFLIIVTVSVAPSLWVLKRIK